MAHNALIRAGAVWSGSPTLLNTELSTFDTRQFQSINGDLGGTWAPSSAIVIGGSGLQIAGTLVIPNGGVIDFQSGATLQLDAGSTMTSAAATALSALLTANGLAGDTNGVFATTSTPTNRKLLWSINLTGTVKARIYAAATDANYTKHLEFTYNAGWNGTQWAADDVANPAAKYSLFTPSAIAAQFDESLFRIFRKATTAATWLDSAWDSGATAFGNGNPAPTAAIEKNTQYAKNIPKAWGLINTDGVGGVSIVDGFNILSVAIASGDIAVTLKQPFLTANYSVTASSGSLGNPAAVGVPSTNSVILLRSYSTTFAQRAAGSNVTPISFVAFGEQ